MKTANETTCLILAKSIMQDDVEISKWSVEEKDINDMKYNRIIQYIVRKQHDSLFSNETFTWTQHHSFKDKHKTNKICRSWFLLKIQSHKPFEKRKKEKKTIFLTTSFLQEEFAL